MGCRFNSSRPILMGASLDGSRTSANPRGWRNPHGTRGTGQPQLVVGDFNATPSDLCAGLPCGPAELLAAGFTDTGAGLGPTCCQSPDLSNTVSILNREYDYIFEKGFSSTDLAALVGNQPLRICPSLWPSDHAGVVATVTMSRSRPPHRCWYRRCSCSAP